MLFFQNWTWSFHLVIRIFFNDQSSVCVEVTVADYVFSGIKAIHHSHVRAAIRVIGYEWFHFISPKDYCLALNCIHSFKFSSFTGIFFSFISYLWTLFEEYMLLKFLNFSKKKKKYIFKVKLNYFHNKLYIITCCLELIRDLYSCCWCRIPMVAYGLTVHEKTDDN